MTLLFPIGLLGLLSIPALVWLWRLQASRRQVRVPSLAPFEQLLQRPPSRRRRLHVNWLFWLQLAALLLAVLALADPTMPSPHSSTTLVLLDTSASMQAALPHSPSPMRRALEALSRRVGRAGPEERLFVVTTAPIRALSAAPITDPAELAPQLARLDRVDLGGTLAAALHVARALLGFLPDRTVVLSDEPKPLQLAGDVEWEAFGAPAPNVAIVGVETSRSLCRTPEGQVVVTVQNFASASQELTVRLAHDGAQVTETIQRVEPFERASLTLPVDLVLEGWVTVEIEAPENALAVDDRAWARLPGRASSDARHSLAGEDKAGSVGRARLPVRVVSQDPVFAQAVGRWLEACPGVAQDAEAAGHEEALVITDQPEPEPDGASRSSVFHRGVATDHRVVLVHWLPEASHPIGRYLEPLERAATAVTDDAVNGQWGDPVLWGVVHGERLPLVTVRESGAQARRSVHIFVDPVATPSSAPLLVTVLNRLSWLAGSRDALIPGEPLTAGSFSDGPVRVQRPDGRSDVIEARNGQLRYDETDRAGLYHLTQGGRASDEAVNFIDPIESDTMHRASTWTDEREQLSAQPAVPARRALAARLLWVVLALWLAEWFLYLRRCYVHGAGG